MISKTKKNLVKKVWVKKTKYYEEAKKASSDVLNHSGFTIINKYLSRSKSILDVGCGEGTKLFKLGSTNSKKTGVDISNEAVSIARKQYPDITFKQVDVENLPFPNNSFQTSYCAFVLEHLENPVKVLEEMIRVTQKDGFVIIVCPNYGSPNRHSPCFKGQKIVKLICGLSKQLTGFGKAGPESWNMVNPLSTGNRYLSDWDTVVEPELLSLINFFRKNSLKIEYWSSLWREEVLFANKIQKIFKILADFKIYPFIFWGPQVLVIARKTC